MCYLLYGAINEDVSPQDYRRLTATARFSLRPGTKEELSRSIKRGGLEFRATSHLCDCDSPFGGGNADDEELSALSQLIHSLRSARNAKRVYLCRTWIGTQNTSEVRVHIDDVDLPSFLAFAKTDCLYQIDLYRRFWQPPRLPLTGSEGDAP